MGKHTAKKSELNDDQLSDVHGGSGLNYLASDNESISAGKNELNCSNNYKTINPIVNQKKRLKNSTVECAANKK